MPDENLYIRDIDWSRFRQYSIHVKSITFNDKMETVNLPWREGTAFLCQHHPFGNCLTPRLRRLRWIIGIEQTAAPIMPFISNRLEELRLEIHLSQFETSDFFLALTHRTPTLKKLSVKSEVWPPSVASSFSGWIETCLGLEEVRIPQRWHTATVLSAFETLPKLSEFGIEWSKVPKDYKADVVNVKITERRFRSLRRLGWTSSITQATNLLQQTPSRLQGLTLHCWGKFSQAELVAFFTAAVQCCPDLDCICLNMADFLEHSKPDLFQDPLSWEIFRPLLACKTLLELSIYCSRPCILSTADIKEIGAAWPKMEKLRLCPDSDSVCEGTPISRLTHIAAALPRLRFLGLPLYYLEPPSSTSDLFPESQLSLKELDIGGSPVPGRNPLPVGLYLASLFAVGTRPLIKAGVSVILHDGAEEWEEVERLVHLMLEIKEAIVRRLS
ncbi:hypothetical protein FRC05_009587 [Tulasnella sp. 425]|nr:hypothetical protein FRC05_009587 [Tulasnella sp. 425]